MSHFSALLTTAVSASGLTQSAVEEATGIDRTVLSRLMSGAIAPSSSNLADLFKKFQPGKCVGHELVFAHMRDVAEEAGVCGVDLHIALGDGKSLREKMPVALAANLDLIAAEALSNSDFASLVNDWAGIIRSHQRALDDKVYPFKPADTDRAVADPKAKKPRPQFARGALPRGSSQETAG